MNAGYSPLPLAKRIGVHACGAAMVLAIPAASYALAIRPIHARTAALTVEQKELVALLDSAPSIRRGNTELQEKISATEQEIASLLRQLPDRASMDPLIAAVSAAAETADAEVLSLQPLTGRSGGETASQTFRLRLRCDHAALCRFLAAIDAGPTPVWVATVDLRGEAVDVIGRGGGLRQAELTLRVPHASEKTFAGHLNRPVTTEPEA